MRITTSMLIRSGVADTQGQRARLARLQEQASSGLALNRPSDDPVGVRTASLLKEALSVNGQYQRNVTRARARMNAVEGALGDTIEVLMTARERAIAGANETAGSEGRAIMATEVEQLHEQLFSNANRRAGGAYVFAGHASETEPFVAGAGTPPAVSFVASKGEVSVEIDQGVQLTVTLDGQRVFMGDADGDGNPDAGREDLFVLLGDLHAALATDDRDAVGATLGRLDTAISQLNRERTSIGASDARASVWEGRLADQEVDLRGQLSLVEDADSIEVFSDLVVRETALQASLEATARMIQPSLLDFL